MQFEYDEAYRRISNELWATRLIKVFGDINRTKIDKNLNTQLDYPNIEFDSKLSGRWGEWDNSSNTIRLSSDLVNNYSWAAVLSTFKHEMAHMIVDRSLGGHSGGPHGKEFRIACQILEIDPNVKSSHADKMEAAIPEREQLISKIEKLFSLGSSPNQNESQSAIAKAHELMVKYDINHNDITTESEIDTKYSIRIIGVEWAKVPTYITVLMRLVSEYYNVKYIRMDRGYSRKYGPRSSKYYVLYGKLHNLDIAEYVFMYLYNEGNRLWEQMLEEKKKNGISVAKVAYITSLYRGYEEKLEESEQIVRQNMNIDIYSPTVPMRIKDELERGYNEMFPKRRMIQSAGYRNTAGTALGREHGRNITINKAVRNTRSSVRMLA